MSEREIVDVYPLSPAQQGILYHTLYDPGSDMYHDQVVCTLRARRELAVDAFAAACRELVARHPPLRTAFSWQRRDRPLQVVLRAAAVPLSCQDWREKDAAAQQQQLAALLQADRRDPFQLDRPPLVRIVLLRLTDELFKVLLSYHHILLDAWSVQVVFGELCELYAAQVQGRLPRLPSAPPYGDYIAWLARQPEDGAEGFWRRTLAGFRIPTRLPAPAVSVGAAAARPGPADHQISLAAGTSAALAAFASRHRLTLATLNLAAWALLLSRTSGEEDVVLGISHAGRPPEIAGVESMVGLFINVLPLRLLVAGNQRLLPWLADLQARQVEARRYEHTPLAKVQAWSDVPRGGELFASLFSFENAPGVGVGGDAADGEITLRDGAYFFRTNYPLNALVVPGEELVWRIVRRGDGGDQASVQRLLQQLATLLTDLPGDSGRRLAEVEGLSEAERHQLLVEWNDTSEAGSPLERPVHELFSAAAAARPEAVALVCEDRRLTYSELNRSANRLAHHLRSLGVGPEAVVGLCAERSPAMAVGILGILKAGGAYLPLDPAYPAERLAMMLEDARPRVVLVDARSLAGLPRHAAPVVPLDLELPAVAGQPEHDPPGMATPDSPAYVIFTSGSTGRPKGVVLVHRGLSDLIPDWNHVFAVGAGDRVLQFASASFDASVWETFSAFVAGASLCYGSRQTLYAGDELLGMLRRDPITRALLPPSLLAVLSPTNLPELGAVSAIGERCGEEVVERWAPSCRLFNAYGPAETTITVAVHRVDPDLPAYAPPIGRPMANTQLFVLDRELRPVAVGVPGELAVGGVRVGRGYLGHPELTAMKFVPAACGRGQRLYRTGDLARFLPDGNLEFLGRADDQVKIRGFRVELGEIEAALRQHPAVERVVVTARRRRGSETGPRLVAYVVPQAGATPGIGEVRSFLSNRLPEHMLPSFLVLLAEIPLSANGKVDRQRLPEPGWDRGDPVADVAPPRTPAEQTLARIWSEVLGVERVGIHDNYFDLGGDSILSIQIIARARRAGLVLNPRQLFEHQTIAALAAVAVPAGGPVEMEEEEGPVPLTAIQRWFLDQGIAEVHHFNQGVVLSLRRPLAAPELAAALERLVASHDALWLSFERVGGEWQQRAAAPAAPFTGWLEIDLSGLPAAEQGAAAAADQVQGSLVLSRAPLLRSALFRLPGGESRLLLTAHHLVVDAMSWRLLLADLSACWGAGGPPPQARGAASFRRWARRLATHARSARLRQELAYWQDQPWHRARRLPRDFQGAATHLEGLARAVSMALTRDETEALLRRLPGLLGGLVEPVFLAALAGSLAPWIGRGHLVVDLERHGREPLFEDVEVAGTVGWLTAFCPLLLELDPSLPPSERLARLAEQVRVIPSGGIGFGVLRYLGDAEARAVLSRLPAAEISLNYLGRLDRSLPDDAPFVLAAAPSGSFRSPRGRRGHLLELDALVDGGQLFLRFSYNPEIHRRDSIERLAQGCAQALQELLTLADSPPAAAKALSERQRLARALAEMHQEGGLA